MPKYQTDLQDIYFNLFKANNTLNYSRGLEEEDIKGIVTEFDKFVENEIYPSRQRADEDGVVLENAQVKVPEYLKEASQKFYANGWYGLGHSEDIGGMPAPESLNLVCSSLFTGANVSLSMYYGLTRGAMNVILQVGTDEQKAKLIPKMMSGEWGGTMCLTEPGAGSDVGASQTTAKLVDASKKLYSIKGVKIFISSGDNDIYQNIMHLVLARVEGAQEGSKGLSLFLVPKNKIDNNESNHVVCTKIEEKMGIHGSATCELTFGQNGECIGELVGAENEGMQNMFIMMNEARLLCGMQGESQANLAYELTKQYAHERSQFQQALYKLPDVKRMLLKMRSLSRGMRALNIYTAHLFDVHHQEKSEESLDQIAFLTPICKAWCSDFGFEVSVDAIQVHGGYGFCTEYGIEQFARDTKIATIYEGTNGIQAIDFVMRKILKDRARVLNSLGEAIAVDLKKLDPKTFSNELALMQGLLGKIDGIIKTFASFMGEKKEQLVLRHCTDFLRYSGNLVVAWLLLKQANIAHLDLNKEQSKEVSLTSEDQEYLQSKIDDAKFFCSTILVQNLALGYTLENDHNDIMPLVL